MCHSNKLNESTPSVTCLNKVLIVGNVFEIVIDTDKSKISFIYCSLYSKTIALVNVKLQACLISKHI